MIIPALNESASISDSVESAFASGADEVIVSDGGSSDATPDVASMSGATVVHAPRGRAVQMNIAAASARSDVLLFLHADTSLPRNACALASTAVDAGFRFGGFRIAFRESDWRLRVAERLINFRSRMTGEPWGDQAQFVDRALFNDCGGFREIPILEDYELARRMRRRTGVAILPAAVTTSGRRFLSKGIVATVATNWRIIAAYEMGEKLDVLEAMYR